MDTKTKLNGSPIPSYAWYAMAKIRSAIFPISMRAYEPGRSEDHIHLSVMIMDYWLDYAEVRGWWCGPNTPPELYEEIDLSPSYI